MKHANDRNRWPWLVTGIFFTTVGALSIHVAMLQVMNVPFPDLSVLTPLARWLIRVTQIVGLMVFWQLAAPLPSAAFIKRWALLFLIVCMLTESLFRGPFMGGYCTGAYAYAFIGNVQALLTLAFISVLVVAVSTWSLQGWRRAIAAFAIATLTMFAATPLVSAAMSPVMKSIAALAPQGEWCALPYGAKVLIPAYVTFLEPTLACVAVAGLVWDRLSPSFGLRLMQFSLIILAIKTQLLMPFLYAALARQPFLHALASEGQFALEALSLAILAGMSWESGCARMRRVPIS